MHFFILLKAMLLCQHVQHVQEKFKQRLVTYHCMPPFLFALASGHLNASFRILLYPFRGRGRHSHQSRGDSPSHGQEGAANDEVLAFAF